VIRTRVGYAGGKKANPTYASLGDHTESVQVDFDPDRISYEALLAIFWKEHDPASTPWSVQYMNAVFYADGRQKEAAERSRAEVERALGRKVSTRILPLATFWRAEDYHQKYALRAEPLLLREILEAYPDPKGFVDSTAAARINGYLAGHGTGRQLAVEIDRLGLPAAARERLRKAVAAWDRRKGRGEAPLDACPSGESLAR
jgi:methionine-S-sulfoxide reductase